EKLVAVGFVGTHVDVDVHRCRGAIHELRASELDAEHVPGKRARLTPGDRKVRAEDLRDAWDRQVCVRTLEVVEVQLPPEFFARSSPASANDSTSTLSERCFPSAGATGSYSARM